MSFLVMEGVHLQNNDKFEIFFAYKERVRVSAAINMCTLQMEVSSITQNNN